MEFMRLVALSSPPKVRKIMHDNPPKSLFAKCKKPQFVIPNVVRDLVLSGEYEALHYVQGDILRVLPFEKQALSHRPVDLRLSAQIIQTKPELPIRHLAAAILNLATCITKTESILSEVEECGPCRSLSCNIKRDPSTSGGT